MSELKNEITPKQSDKTLQERLNEVCEKHGVSTLQDLDWAFCESEKRRTRDFIEAAKEIEHHKYKRCLDKAKMCKLWYEKEKYEWQLKDVHHWFKMSLYDKWQKRWLELAEKFKEAK